MVRLEQERHSLQAAHMAFPRSLLDLWDWTTRGKQTQGKGCQSRHTGRYTWLAYQEPEEGNVKKMQKRRFPKLAL